MRAHWTAPISAATVVALSLGLASASFAQRVPFSILRPRDGAMVRGDVTVTIPKASVPDGSYLTLSINGKFLQAFYPESGSNSDTVQYTWDTKQPLSGKPVADGDYTISFKLFTKDEPKPVDSTEVRVRVANKSGIFVDSGLNSGYRRNADGTISVASQGVMLKYYFTPGNTMKFNMDNGLLGIPQGTQTDNPTPDATGKRKLYSSKLQHMFMPIGKGELPNRGDSLAVVRQQRITTKETVGDSAPVTTSMNAYLPLTQFMAYSGDVVYTLTQKSADPSRYPVINLPNMPERIVAPGAKWNMSLMLSRPDSNDSSITRIPATASAVGYEWENNLPCMRIQVTADRPQPTAKPGFGEQLVKRMQFEGTIWYGITVGKVVRFDGALTVTKDKPDDTVENDPNIRAFNTGGSGTGMTMPGMGGGGMTMPGMGGGGMTGGGSVMSPSGGGGTTGPSMPGGMMMPRSPSGGGGMTGPSMPGMMTMPGMGGGGMTGPSMPGMGGGMTMPGMGGSSTGGSGYSEIGILIYQFSMKLQ